MKRIIELHGKLLQPFGYLNSRAFSTGVIQRDFA